MLIMTELKTKSEVFPREQFELLYEHLFPVVATSIRKKGGSYEQIKDIFQDALIIYYEKSVLDEVEIENTEAYITQVANYLWFKRFRESRRWVEIDNLSEQVTETVEELDKPVSGMLLKFLESAGKKCMDLLKAFYYWNNSLDEIAEEYGFSGTRSATVQKYKCLEKLRNEVKEKEMSYAHFLE